MAFLLPGDIWREISPMDSKDLKFIGELMDGSQKSGIFFR